ncbi:SAM-dependent methyltransferase [Nocardia sp. NPDC051052]|uniref:SAM-dependent methyltransferase n=1 Tax=Nocardia sp. NPDC051052 TaxID=3364322 RepID=UPI0037AFC882
MTREPDYNPNVPASARIWNYLISGKDNYDTDREVADRMLAIAPDTKTLAWLCRDFHSQAVQSAAEAGVRQFIDLGAGMPTYPDVREVARKIEPSARILYVDNDPIVHAHCDALLTGWVGTAALKADIRSRDLIEKIQAESVVDFAEPVAVLMTQVMDYVSADEQPEEIIRALREAMAPGSRLVITHASDESDADLRHQMIKDTKNSPAEPTFRTREEIELLIKGFDIPEPGLVPVQQALDPELPETRLVVLSAVCRLEG